VNSPKNLLILVLSLLSAALSLIAWQQYQRVQSLTTVAAAAPSDDTAQKLQAAQRYIADLEARLKTAPASVAAAENAPPGDPTAPAEARRGSAEFSEGRRAQMAALFNDPEVQQLMATQQRTQLDSRYAALFKQLNLTPSQIETFKNLLLEKQTARRDVMMAARESGLSPRENRDELGKLVEQSNNETDAQILATLGQEKFAQYKAYEATGSQRALVDQISRSLSYSATPLTDAQSQALVQVLAQNPPPNSPPATDRPGGDRFMRSGSVTITDAAIAQSQNFLSPAQVKILQEQQASQQASAKLEAKMNAARRNRPIP
jgi:hypothetical protein